MLTLQSEAQGSKREIAALQSEVMSLRSELRDLAERHEKLAQRVNADEKVAADKRLEELAKEKGKKRKKKESIWNQALNNLRRR